MRTTERAILCSLVIAILLGNAVVLTGFPVASAQASAQNVQGIEISAEIGISWLPHSAGDYEIRTFVLSDFNSPRVLSPTVTSEVRVVAKLRFFFQRYSYVSVNCLPEI